MRRPASSLSSIKTFVCHAPQVPVLERGADIHDEYIAVVALEDIG